MDGEQLDGDRLEGEPAEGEPPVGERQRGERPDGERPVGEPSGRPERVAVVMAAIAAREPAAVFRLYREFGGELRGAMRRELRRLGVERVSAEDLDGTVMDACFALFDCGAAWDPDGGALPWNWARARLGAVASAWVGQHADELEVEGMDAWSDVPQTSVTGDEAELDVLARLAERNSGCALVLEALERVASARDRVIVLEVWAQVASGDPSPAVTVGSRHRVTPEVVRQVVRRVRARLARLAATEDRFSALSDLPIVG